MSPTTASAAQTPANENAVADVAAAKARRYEELKAMGDAYVEAQDQRLRAYNESLRKVEEIERELLLKAQRQEHGAQDRELIDPITRELAEALRHLRVPVLVVPAHLAYKNFISDDLVGQASLAGSPRLFHLGGAHLDGAAAAGVTAAPVGKAY